MPEYLIGLKADYQYPRRKLSDGTLLKSGKMVAIDKKLWEELRERDIVKGPEYAEFIFEVKGGERKPKMASKPPKKS